MKKAIYLTIGSIVLAGGITATAVCVPAFVNTLGNNPKIFTFNPDADNLQFNADLASSVNVSFKEAVLGSKKISNGTYFIYIGSQAYDNNNKFLYGNSVSFQNDILANPATLTLKGDFGKGLKTFNDLKEKPTVLMVQDIITAQMRQDANNYENKILEWKQITDEEIQNLRRQDKNKEAEELAKKKSWAQSAPTFSYEPGATYENWEGKTVKFRTDAYAQQFLDMVKFVESKFSNLKDIKSSDGIIIGYKDGKICSNFSGSFVSSSSSDSSNSDSSTSTQSAFFSTYSAEKTSTSKKSDKASNKNKNTKEGSESGDNSSNSGESGSDNGSNENQGSGSENGNNNEENQNTSFSNWLKENYGNTKK